MRTPPLDPADVLGLAATAAATAVHATHPANPAGPARWRRADLHCHSIASTEADEALLIALKCPECYSDPAEVYAQAKGRGMDFVTITDHDVLDGVLSLGRRADVIVGEELTCYFPEDRCKMHVLVWGVTPADHVELQARAADIYRVAEYVEDRRIAHAVAHPLYRQNDLLGRWHLERLILLFKGFECVNGAHSLLHKEAFEPVLDHLTEEKLIEITARHGLRPRWPQPWVKARTGGSDDHGLLNVGRTWTEFPPDVTTPEQALEAIRAARCRPGGEPGSSLKLAHNFLGVGIRHYVRTMAPAASGGRATTVVRLLETLVGDRRPPRKRDLIRAAVRGGIAAAGRRIARPFARPFRRRPAPGGTALLGRLAWQSFRGRTSERRAVLDALARGVAPLGEHQDVFRLVTALDRDVTSGLLATVGRELARGDMAPLFDALSTVAAQQFALLPYYFALFHQNRERHLCGGVTGHGKAPAADTLKVGLFTDTFDDVNGVARFLERVGATADARGRQLTIVTCAAADPAAAGGPHPCRTNFAPVAAVPLPHYPELTLSLPPVLEILEWADRQQFDAIHVSTPGPMGLVGLLVARMLKVPVVATYHTDFPAFVRDLTGDYRLTAYTTSYMSWFYRCAATVFARSRSYESALAGLGVAPAVVRVLPPCTDADAFHPRNRDPGLYDRLGVRRTLRLLYVGRISAEKNLRLLADAFTRLCETRDDVALVVVGDGPLLPELKRRLAGRPAHLGYRSGAELAALYASADLFVFPSRTDTLGQAVIEAQASGLPVLVSDAGGPREVMDDGVTGRVVAGTAADDWAAVIDELLDDVTARSRMSRSAAARAARYTRSDVFDTFWEHHVRACREADVGDLYCEPEKKPTAPEPVAGTAAADEASHERMEVRDDQDSRIENGEGDDPGRAAVPRPLPAAARSPPLPAGGGLGARGPPAGAVRAGGAAPAAPSSAAAPRILILSASAGIGHLRAAEAVELALGEMCPGAHVVNVDVLDLTNAAFRHFYGRSYFDLVRNVPHLIGYLYDTLDKPVGWKRVDRARARFQRLHLGKVVDLIESQPWDLAINTHFLPAEVIGALRDAKRIDFPQVMVTTDFYIHAMWVKQPVERYYAASEESAVNLSAHLPAGDIEVTGIPVHPAFAARLDRDACRRKHGLPLDRHVVLQLAGGFGVGPMEQVHRGILAARQPLHVVVAAGRNAAARAKLESIPLPPRHGRTVLGFTTEMHELMAAADLIVSKPGGLTTSEALATGTPMVVVDPIPGQEDRNSDFLLEHGAAVKANTFTCLPYKLDRVLGDPQRLTAMGEAARRIGRPGAAFDVARRAIGLIRRPVEVAV